MYTNQNTLKFFKVICVLMTFASVHCNENVKVLEQVISDAEDADVAVQFNLSPAVSPDGRSEEIFLDTIQLANKCGYEVQVHEVITDDGYNLTLFQMFGRNLLRGNGNNVFLMHGILGSSDDYLVSGPGKALACLLADAGYIVWLGNARGNKYSRNHLFLDPELEPFWDFTWHDIGVNDLPAMVDHILMDNETQALTYIGHGQGTTVFFVLNSERPEYNEKFNLMFSLGTTAWLWHLRSPVLRSLTLISDSQFELLENLGFYEIFPDSLATEFVTSRLCCSSRPALLTCMTILFNIIGFDYNQIDYDNACVKLTHFPSGSSLRQLQHFVQLVRSKEFAQFDYGREENLVTYGSPTPPHYDVESITVSVVIFYCDNDWISNFDDALILIHRLPNVMSVKRVPHSKCNHFDFIWAKDGELLLYRKIIDIIDENVSECRNEKCGGSSGKLIP